MELVIETGRRLRVWGIEAPQVAGVAPAGGRDRLLGWLASGPVAVSLLAAGADRWGRTEAHVHGPRPGRPQVSVAEALVDAGLARVRPEADDVDCQQRLRGLEAYARRLGLGLWSDPKLRPLAAADRAAFKGRAGEQIIVQGRVDSVNATGYATYINFGPIRTVDFAVTVRSRLRPQVEALVGPLDALPGRLVEVRGLLDGRFGPQIDIEVPTALQRLDESVTGSPYSGRESRQ